MSFLEVSRPRTGRSRITWLEAWLDECATRSSPASSDQVLLAEWGRAERFDRLVAELLSSDAELDRIAHRSYRHLNFFDKIVLAESSSTGYRLTLHLWSPPFPEDTRADRRIHSHRFAFASTVVIGS